MRVLGWEVGYWQESSWVALNTTTKSMIWAERPWHLPDTHWAFSWNHSITPLSIRTFSSFLPSPEELLAAGWGPASFFFIASPFLFSHIPLLENRLSAGTTQHIGNRSKARRSKRFFWGGGGWVCFYLRNVRGRDDPSAVSVVVILDWVVGRRDDSIWPSQLTSAHGCCNQRRNNQAL